MPRLLIIATGVYVLVGCAVVYAERAGSEHCDLDLDIGGLSVKIACGVKTEEPVEDKGVAE